jgi:hypothetical protein
MMQMRDGEAPKRKVSCYTVRPGTLESTLALWRVVCCSLVLQPVRRPFAQRAPCRRVTVAVLAGCVSCLDAAIFDWILFL